MDCAKDKRSPQAKNNKSYFLEAKELSIKLLMSLAEKHLADLLEANKLNQSWKKRLFKVENVSH